MTKTSNTTASAGKRQAERVTKTTTYPIEFRPRHCGGTSCLHNHTGASTPLPRLGLVQRVFGKVGAA